MLAFARIVQVGWLPIGIPLCLSLGICIIVAVIIGATVGTGGLEIIGPTGLGEDALYISGVFQLMI